MLCYSTLFAQLKESWKGYLQLNDSTPLPVQFIVATHDGQTALEFQNGSEHIRTEEAIKSGDSLVFKMPVFDSELHLKLTSSQIKGNWINHARQDHNIIAFTAQKASAATAVKTPCRLLHNEHWKVRFSPNGADEYPAIGLFQLDESNGTLQGTFLTETGDYRFLSGTAKPSDHGYALTFGCFDGSHAFLFKALLDTASKSMQGTFYSGADRKSTRLNSSHIPLSRMPSSA